MYDGLIKLAAITRTGDTNTRAPVVQTKSFGGVGDTMLVQPYGFTSMPPEGAMAIVFCVNDQAANRVGIAVDLNGRMKGLVAGETAVQNSVKATYIYLNNEGNIVIEANQGNVIIQNANEVNTDCQNATVNAANEATINATTCNVNADDCNITADLNVVGDVDFTGRFHVNGHDLSETHKHSGVLPGAFNTGDVI